MTHGMRNIFRQSFPDTLFRWTCAACAFAVIILIAGILLQLAWHSIPAITQFGVSFLWSTEWDPVRDRFGAASSICGTLLTTLVAMCIAVPFAFLAAMFLVELAPPEISKVISQALDLLAAIPSIIYGMWGLFVFVPFMQAHIQPFISNTLGLKVLPFFKGPIMGFGIMTAGLVLALMILPFICAVMRDVFKMVPPVVKESAYGMGATTWEVTYDVTMRYGMQGLLGAVFLGLGRAIGETMAGLFIIGNSPKIPDSLYDSGNTIASVLASNFAEADGVFRSSLFLLGLILLLITLGIQILAQIWLNKVRNSAGAGL